ncbi:MAG TPA: T9SS type A sorting domain-containing protein, partial [Bacteroidota bacterium]|nr:T9SS type A sorting domain-containing protein [Bacteroidota bacterium]
TDVETPDSSLLVSATSSNTSVLPNGNITLGGSDSNRTITLTPATGMSGVSIVDVKVFDGTDSTTETFNFTVNASDITIKKFFDNDGNPATTGDQSAKTWRLSLYQDSVSQLTLLASADTSTLYYTGLNPGTYIATEADSGATWTRINGNLTFNDTITVASSSHTIDTFVNSRTFDLTIRKYVDLDGNLQTTGDQSVKTWHLSLYQGQVAPANLIASADTNLLFASHLSPGLYIATEADSGASWRRINGNMTLNDTLTIGASIHSVDTFINFRPFDISVSKFVDLDGNPTTTADQSAKKWHLSLYRGSVAPANLLAAGDTSLLIVPGLTAGTYIATEADSGASWTRINGNLTSNDTLTVSGSLHWLDTFVNFEPNAITIQNFEANDGKFGTSFSHALKNWHLELHRDSANGALVAHTDSSALSVGNLGNGTYFAVEADSASWQHLGYYLDGVANASPATAVSIVVSSGGSGEVDFYNSPPIYGQSFRGFRQDSLALDADHSGKIGKAVSLKPARVLFTAVLRGAPNGANGVHVEFGVGIDTTASFTTVPASTHSTTDAKLGKWNFSFGSPLAANDSVQVTGLGSAGKLQKVASYTWTVGGLSVGSKLKDATFSQNTLKLLMPNRVNALETAYAGGGFASTSGLLVGEVKKGATDSSKFYGWVLHKKPADVLKSLYSKKDNPPTHDGAPRGFSFTKAQGSLPKDKYNDILFANLVALKLNIVASELGVTPVGFGQLIYDDTTESAFNGMMVSQIATVADSLVMGYYYLSTHLFESPSTFNDLNNVVGAIDSAFEGSIDTMSFAGTLVFKGVRPLSAVSFLHANPNVQPVTIQHGSQGGSNIPLSYRLYQNYPNPFNPTTVVSFDLVQSSSVTIKVFNILGQEVQTLVNNELLEAGNYGRQFNANQFASGVYFYRIIAQPVDGNGIAQSGAFISVKKMMLIK